MKTNHLFIVAVLVATLFSSCKDAYKKAIPTDAIAVAEINMASLGLKSDLIGQKDRILDVTYQLIDDEEIVNEIKKALKESKASGINPLKPAYVFFTMKNEGEGFVLLAVKDKDKLTEALKDEAETIKLEESQGLTYIIVENVVYGAFSDKALIVGSPIDRLGFRDMLKQDNGYFSTDAGKLLEKKSKDITIVASYDAVPDEYKDMIQKELERTLRRQYGLRNDLDEQLDKIEKALFALNVEFNKGDILFNLFVEGIEQANTNGAIKIDRANVSDIPTNNLVGLFAMGIDGKETWELVSKSLEEELGKGKEQEMFSRIGEYVEQLNGTATAAIYMRNADADPDVYAIIPAPKDELTALCSDLGVAEYLEAINIDGNNKNTTISTMSDPQIKNFEQSKAASSNYMYAYINTTSICDMTINEAIRPRRQSEEEQLQIRKAFDIGYAIDYVELFIPEINQLTLRCVMSNKSDNALSILLSKTIDWLEAYHDYEVAEERTSRSTNNYDIMFDEYIDLDDLD